MKNETWFIDIDGTVLHMDRLTGQSVGLYWNDPELICTPNAREALDALERAGHHIVLCTARPEHNREFLLKLLASRGIAYHQLVMGCTSGTRIIVNDTKPSGVSVAESAEVPRNQGLGWILSRLKAKEEQRR